MAIAITSSATYGYHGYSNATVRFGHSGMMLKILYWAGESHQMCCGAVGAATVPEMPAGSLNSFKRPESSLVRTWTHSGSEEQQVTRQTVLHYGQSIPSHPLHDTLQRLLSFPLPLCPKHLAFNFFSLAKVVLQSFLSYIP